MANGLEKDVLFSDEELREMSGVKRNGNYIEVTCGCTSRRYGDAVGRLWVFINGELEISCECTPGCNEEKLSPAAFEKHSGRETARKWKNNVWVMIDGCKKERRFRLRTKEECRIHHDALADPNWKCADLPFYKMTCDDDEERASQRGYRGCSRSPRCLGCTSCVCFGCHICQFAACSCQTCLDFTRNATA